MVASELFGAESAGFRPLKKRAKDPEEVYKEDLRVAKVRIGERSDHRRALSSILSWTATMLVDFR